jgi:hypothetical protein
LPKRYAVNLNERIEIEAVSARLKQLGTERDSQIKELSRRQLIDVWLNTVFAHSGLKPPRKGRQQLTRSDFDRLSHQYGHGFFEYAIRMAILFIGFKYIGLCQRNARPALSRWKERFGLEPSFEIGAAFGAAFEETTREGHLVVRKGSSQFHNEETFEQRFRRILNRDLTGGLNFALTHLDALIAEPLADLDLGGWVKALAGVNRQGVEETFFG